MPELAVTLPWFAGSVVLYWPWALVAVVLPIIVRLLMSPTPAPQTSLRWPHFPAMPLHSKRLFSWRRYRVVLVSLSYMVLVIASARPVVVGDQIQLPRTGRDLMLVIDISQSMGQQDWGVSTTRMSVVKQVVGDFITRRFGDRVGIILFGSRAYLQTPLTFDLEAIQLQLNEATVGMAGPATALGDAIGLTIKHLRDTDAQHKVMILVSDGATNAGRVSAEEAAQVAVDFGLTVHTIGVGSIAHSETGSFDAVLLQSLADASGGQFFQARARSELEVVYRVLDAIEPATIESEIVRQTTELYPWPLALALLLACLTVIGEMRTRFYNGKAADRFFVESHAKGWDS